MKRFIVFLIALIGLIGLVGCKTTSEVSRVQKSDTVVVIHSDTVSLWKTQILWRDSIVRDSIMIERDTTGRIVYKEVVRNRYVRLHHHDTIILYQSSRDSTARSATTATLKQKQPPRRRKGRWKWALIAIVLIVAGAGLFLYRKKNKSEGE